MNTDNPFYRLALKLPTVQSHRAVVLDAIAASVAHETWEELYAARRGVYKVTGTYLAGNMFEGALFARWCGCEPDFFTPEQTGMHGLQDTRDAAHEFLDALSALKGS